MARSIPFSVLDLAPVPTGSTSADALRNTLELARLVDRLGYHRYWLAEHHNMPGIASSTPAVMIGHVADATSRIRVGSGGVMLPNHAPLVVAEQFGTLEALHPGRIDLGIGRAPGTDPHTARALRRSEGPLSADDFPEQLVDLIGFFEGSFPDDHPFRRIHAVPAFGNAPAMWLLGSSGYSAQVAGLLGLPFAFAHHFSSANTLPALELYRSTFRPSDVLTEPYAMIAANVVCADTDEDARWLAGSGRLSMLRMRRGQPSTLPSPEEAAEHQYTDEDLQVIQQRANSNIVGAPATVRREIDELCAATAADELMITTVVYEHARRLHSYELIADLYGLSPD